MNLTQAAIQSPVDIPGSITRYQNVLQNARSAINFSFSCSFCMAPSDMLLPIGIVNNYDNNI